MVMMVWTNVKILMQNSAKRIRKCAKMTRMFKKNVPRPVTCAMKMMMVMMVWTNVKILMQNTAKRIRKCPITCNMCDEMDDGDDGMDKCEDSDPKFCKKN